MYERKLELGDPSHDELLRAGLAKYSARQLDTPEARYFVRQDVKGQHRYAGEKYEAQIRSLNQGATQLVLFETLTEADDYQQVA